MLNLKLETNYSLLLKYFKYDSQTSYMLGHQIGIVVKNNHNINYYRNLYEHYEEKLEILLENYRL